MEKIKKASYTALAAVLFIVVCAVLVAAFGGVSALPSEDARTPLPQASHDHVGWNELTAGGELTSGNYYLAEDVSLESSISIKGDVTLCLNGHKLVSSVCNAIVVNSGTFTLLDCDGSNGSHSYYVDDKGKYVFDNGQEGWQKSYDDAVRKGEIFGGVITSTYRHSLLEIGGGMLILGSAAMYGGTIAGFDMWSGAGIEVQGSFTMFGGAIEGNFADDNDAISSSGDANIYGGCVKGKLGEFAGPPQGVIIAAGGRFDEKARASLVEAGGVEEGYVLIDDSGYEGHDEAFPFAVLKQGGRVSIGMPDEKTFVYDGGAADYSVEASAGDEALEVYYSFSAAKDGEYAPGLPVDAGAWYVKATSAAISGSTYYGSVERVDPIVIEPKPITREMVSGIDDNYVYSGSAIEPVAEVTDGGRALVLDQDYTVTYGGNTTVAQGGKVVVEGVGNYQGAVEVGFDIAKAPGSAAPGYEIPTNLTVIEGESLSTISLPVGWAWQDGSLVASAPGSMTATLIYTPADAENYAPVSATVTVSVQAAVPEPEPEPEPELRGLADKIGLIAIAASGAMTLFFIVAAIAIAKRKA